jgi:tetratricopeptide (TPR) repeat protein
LVLEPSYDVAWNNLGNVLESQGTLAPAREAYARAVDLAPEHATYRLNLASVLARGDDPRSALQHLERAVALAPEIRSLLEGFAEFATLLDDSQLNPAGREPATPERGPRR